MNHLRLFWTCLLCLALGPSPLPAAAQSPATPPALASAPAAVTVLSNPKTPEEFFARARQMSDLEASGIPFHLKATFVASGDAEFTGNGTYEEWWQSKDLWRKEATLGDYKYWLVRRGRNVQAYASSSYTPLRLRQAIRHSLVDLSVGIETEGGWSLQHQQMNGVEMTVLSANYLIYQTSCQVNDVFTSEGMLRVQENCTIADLYNRLQPFQELLIPRDITVQSGGEPFLQISIVTLEALNPNAAELSNSKSIPAGMESVLWPYDPFSSSLNVKPAVDLSDARPAKLIRSKSPKYPAAAKAAKLRGTVVINATIDAQGNVREPYVLVSVADSLDKAALDAVRDWKYKPLEIHKTAYSVDTTISVVFTLNH
ncbi:MAG: energy transducer TonB [Acidobacteriaceae bacterium]